MAVVLTSFTTANGTIRPSEFRTATPKRCKLKTSNLPSELQERYGVEQLAIEFPFGPKDMKFGSLAAKMDQIDRPGKKPLLEKRNEQLRMVSFNAVIAGTVGPEGGRAGHVTGTTPVDPALETIERIAASGATCKFNYGTVQLGFSVVLTKFDFTVKHRDSEGHPVRVDAQFQLTEKPVFSQELTNLPVIPIDPPEQPVAGTPETPEEDQTISIWSNSGSRIVGSQEDEISENQQLNQPHDPLLISTYNEVVAHLWAEYGLHFVAGQRLEPPG